MKKQKLPNPADLVSLYNIGELESVTMWETWEDYDESGVVFWPRIVGNFYKHETAIVLDISGKGKGSAGAKIWTDSNVLGWVVAKYLMKMS